MESFVGEAVASDRELLGRFAASRDAASFAGLVERHGRMVLATCRRMLPAGGGADDAYQATFLVLMAEAGRLSRNHPEGRSLGPWLHRVATNSARQALRAERARRRREQVVARRRGEAGPGEADADLLAPLIDREIQGLPERLRTPLILCDLDGVTQQAAAAELGLSFATLRRRLDEARALLRERLSRTGVGIVPAALLALILAPAARADVAAAAPASPPMRIEPKSASSLAQALAWRSLLMRKMHRWRNRLAAASLAASILALPGLMGQAGAGEEKAKIAKRPAASRPAQEAPRPTQEAAIALPTSNPASVPKEAAKPEPSEKTLTTAKPRGKTQRRSLSSRSNPGFVSPGLRNLPIGANAQGNANAQRNRQANAQAFDGVININGREMRFNNPQEFQQAKQMIMGNAGMPGLMQGAQAGAFDGVININGREQRFNNPQEFQQAQQMMMNGLPNLMQGGFANGSSAQAFDGVININGREQRFNNPQEFQQAQQMMGGFGGLPMLPGQGMQLGGGAGGGSAIAGGSATGGASGMAGGGASATGGAGGMAGGGASTSGSVSRGRTGGR